MTMTNKGTQTLTTNRLILRRFTVEDAPAMYANWATDERTTLFLIWSPHESVDETRGIIERWVAEYEKPDYYHWVIDFAGTLVGTINLHGISERAGRCELGYCLGSRWWNLGIGTEAARAVMDFAFSELGAHSLRAAHDEHNVASGRVMQKLGMMREGSARDYMLRRDGSLGDLVWYSILRDEWTLGREIRDFCASPCAFDGFCDLPDLADGELSLSLTARQAADPVKNYVPCYAFDIMKGGERIGSIRLRVGYTQILYYAGNIGYGVDEAHRGQGYAGRACKLLIPLMRAHGMTRAFITNDQDNLASRRVCEKLGATRVRLARVPEWTEQYQAGRRFVNVFDWRIDEPPEGAR